jgi:hypothetical protein
MLVKEVDEKAMSVMEQTLLAGDVFDMYDFMLEGSRGRRGSTEGKKEEKKTLGDLPKTLGDLPKTFIYPN